MATIALDYDNTYTMDPEGWNQFIELFHDRGVYCVTYRYKYPLDENQDIIQDLKGKVFIYFTKGCIIDTYSGKLMRITLEEIVANCPEQLRLGQYFVNTYWKGCDEVSMMLYQLDGETAASVISKLIKDYNW